MCRITTPNARKGGSFPMKGPFIAIVLTFLCTVLAACGSATASGRQEVGTATAAKPEVIYVFDFDLEASNVKSETGWPKTGRMRPGPLKNIRSRLTGAAKDRSALANHVVDLMSTSIVRELTKAGQIALRLTSDSTPPTSGWLVRGVFTEVDEGNRLRRAVIGFGAGETDLHVLADISDLSQGKPKRFYKLDAAADSGRAPGAGPLIVLGPAGVAARFVIASEDLDRNVQETAAKIAAEVLERARQSPSVPAKKN